MVLEVGILDSAIAHDGGGGIDLLGVDLQENKMEIKNLGKISKTSS